MGVAVGDNLTFLIAGENITAEISSIREVDWNSFSPNFFLVFSRTHWIHSQALLYPACTLIRVKTRY